MEPHALLDHPSLVQLWRWLTEPSSDVDEPVERRRATSLSAMLTAYIPILIVSTLLTLINHQEAAGALIGLMVVIGCYFVSRTRYYSVAGWVALITLWAMPLILLLIDPTFGVYATIFLLQWTILAMFLGWILLPGRGMILFLAITFLGVAAGGWISGSFNSDYATFLFSFMTMLTMLVIVVLLLRREDMRERAIAEQSLRQREERYRLITQFMTDYTFSTRITADRQWVVEWVEGAWTQITGVSLASLSDLKWINLVHPDDVHILQQSDNQALSNQPGIFEYRIIARGGEVRWVRQYSFPIWSDAEGRVVRIVGGVQDITERKHAEQQAEEQRRLAEALRDTAATLSSTLDQDEVLDRILDGVFKVTPASAADIMLIETGMVSVARSRGFETDDPNDDLARLRFAIDAIPSFHKMFLTGESSVVPDTEADSSWVKLEPKLRVRSHIGVPIILDGITMGFINACSSQARTFTEAHVVQLRAFAHQAAIAIRNALLFEEVRRYADALGMIVVERNNELNFERERLRAILESSGEGVLYTENLIIKYVNRAFAQMTGYEADELIDQSMTMLADPKFPKDELIAGLHRLESSLSGERETWRGEFNVARKDGSIFTAGITVTAVNNPDDGVTRTVSIIRDITRDKMLRDQQSQFVAHASHELRTPITNFKTRLHLLKRDPAHLNDHIAVMEEVSDRMRRLVNDLLDLTRFERGVIPVQLRSAILQTIIARVIRAQRAEAERKRLQLHIAMPDLPLIVRVDEERIIQVITNLVTNAINYTPEDGHIWVTVDAVDDSKSCIIRVRDTGIGIAPEHLPFIFEPFYRVPSEVEGTGLGLSIARELIHQHSGTIHVMSQIGGGSTFEIMLPLLASQTFDSEQPSATHET